MQQEKMPMSRFIVFDVETPNRYNNRMSAIGICVVESGRITDFGGECCQDLEPEMFNGRCTILA